MYFWQLSVFLICSLIVQGLSVSLISQEPNFGTINTYYCLLSSFYTNLTLQLYIVTGLQNLCISSSLVCVIILIASLVVFWVGFILRQVPPVLIVSVLYVLAGNSKVLGKVQTDLCFEKPKFHLKIWKQNLGQNLKERNIKLSYIIV